DGTVYHWFSIEAPQMQPMPTYHSYAAPNGKRFPVLEGSMETPAEPQFCELQIQTDAHHHIQRISIVNDSIGKWSNSLCTEIFSP
ncbi:MAG: hypothetical protein KGJ06_07265, partial [Pseudomonadota bacterium]|nr:hypothetical protein [Pseudomonadota bacterium]